MEEHKIVPEIIDVAPKNKLEVIYPSGKIVDFGNELTPIEVKDIPIVKWEADDDKLYILLMIDPDAPSRQNHNLREVRHWMVINIPGNNVENGQIVHEFIGSGAPKNTGLHRYIFLVFEQQEKIETTQFTSNRSSEGRLGTNTRDLMKEYKLGDPIAGNFYQAQYDHYSDVLYEQLNSK